MRIIEADSLVAAEERLDQPLHSFESLVVDEIQCEEVCLLEQVSEQVPIGLGHPHQPVMQYIFRIV